MLCYAMQCHTIHLHAILHYNMLHHAMKHYVALQSDLTLKNQSARDILKTAKLEHSQLFLLASRVVARMGDINKIFQMTL